VASHVVCMMLGEGMRPRGAKHHPTSGSSGRTSAAWLLRWAEKGGGMTTDEWEALGVQTFGLTRDLIVPIAAADLETIDTYVGTIQTQIAGRKRPTNAIVVVAHRPIRNPQVPLWGLPEADQYYRRLHPLKQLWVHVDYSNYRGAWKRLGFGELTPEVVLDHIQNRAAVRLTGYRHPFLRLCPVSRDTNTSGGLDIGAEGMEKTEWRQLREQPAHIRERMTQALRAPVILADPIDLTKMLDMPPGLGELRGVGSMLMKYYARTD
jgi:hypothetical protein